MQIENICINCMQEKNNPNESCPHCGFDSRSYTMSGNHLPPFTILNGKYLLGRVVGEGGFGIVYIAKDLYLNITVAVKELFLAQQMTRLQNGYTQHLSVSYSIGSGYVEEIKKKFIQEAQTIAQLQATAKEGVTNVKDFFEENGTAYMVMEYFEGGTLKDYLKKDEKIEFETVIKMLKPVIRSLKKIHDVGIIHRDISPDNIMLLTSGEVKLIDFGGIKDVHRSKVKSEVIQVKKGYTPIEQYQVEGNIGPWTDIYALCATIYRCITGQLLPEPMEIGKNGATPPSQLGVKIPKKAEEALMKGLQIDYTKRTQDIQELYDAIYSNISSYAGSNKRQSGGNGKKIVIGGVALAVVGIGAFAGITVMNSNPFDSKKTGSVVKGLNGYYEINSVSRDNLCWTVKNDYFTGAELSVMQNTELKNQCFAFIDAGDDRYNIINTNTGLALTLSEDPILGSNKVVQSELVYSEDQEWQIVHDGETDSYLFNIALDDGSIAYATVKEAIEGQSICLQKYDNKSAESYRWNIAGISNDSAGNRISETAWESIIEIPENIYTLENNGEVISVQGNYTNDGYIVCTAVNEDHNYQKIRIVKGEDGFYTMYAFHSNSMLGTLAEEAGVGSGLVQWAGAIDNGNQKWEFIYCGVDQVIIRSQNGLCIGRGTEDDQVRLYDYDVNNPNIVWKINTTVKNEFDEAAVFDEPPLGTLVEVIEGTYYVQSRHNENILLGVDGGYSDDGMVVKQTIYEEKNSNRFYLVRKANGFYSLVASHTNMYICPDDTGALRQYSEGEIGGEENSGVWELLYAGQETFFIRNVSTGMCIGTATGETSEGLELVLVDYNEENLSTYWKLIWTEKDNSESAPVTMFEATTPVGSVLEVTEGTYMLQASVNEGILLGIEDGYADDGMALKQVDYEERNSNKFYWVRGTGDYSNRFALIAVHSDKFIAPDENGTLHQYSEGSDYDKYRWQTLYSGIEGTYYIQDVNQNCIGSYNGIVSGENMGLVPVDSANDTICWKLVWTEKNELERDAETKEDERTVGEQVGLEEGCYSIYSSLDQSMVLSVTGGYWDDGTEVICSENEGKNSQKVFVVSDPESGAYSLFAAHSNKKIIYSETSGVACQFYQEETSSSSLWNFLYAGDGSYFIINQDGYCLDLEGDAANMGTKVVFSQYNPDDAGQKWFVQWTEYNSEEVTTPMYEGDFILMGTSAYELASLTNGVSCWALSQEENSGQIITWERVNDATQQFYFEEVEPYSDDVNHKKYRIIPAKSDKVLTVMDDGLVMATDWTGAENQLWQIVYGGFGTYCIRSEDGRFITSTDGTFTNGGALSVKAYEETDASNMKWFMEAK